MPLFGPPNIDKLIRKENVKGLIKALSYPQDKSIRTAAAEALGLLEAKQAIPALIQALQDPEAWVSEASEKALRGMLTAAVPGLIKTLSEPDLQIKACQLLGAACDPRAVEHLLPLLKNNDPAVRMAAADALGEIGDPRACRHLAGLLRAEDRALREAVIQALGHIDAPCSREALLPLLSDPEEQTRAWAAAALDAMGWQPTAAADQVRLLTAGNNWEEIPALGSRAIPALMAMLDRDVDTDRIQKIVQALESIGDPAAVDALIARYPDFPGEEPLTGEKYLVHMLGQLGGDAAAERLIALLAEERYRFEYENAIEALGETGSPKAVPHLIKYLKSHPDSGAARNALVKIGEPAISDLSRLLSRGSWPLRIAAAQALAELDWQPRTPRQKILFTISRTEEAGPAAQSLNEDAIDFLIDALEEESLRSYALKMLGQIGDPRAMEALLPLLSDPGSAEYTAAIGVLEKLASPETVPVLIRALEHQPPHSPIGDILSRMGKAALPALVEQFEDGTLPIQYTAIEVMGKAGDRSAIPILKKVLRTGPWPLRFAAAPALASLDWTPMSFKEKALFALCQQQWDRVQDLGQIAVDPLIHLLQDDSMRHDDLLRIKAIEALGEIGDAQALDVLLDYLDLKHVYRDVRMAAAKTLIRLYQQGNLSQAQKKRILQNKAAIIKADHRDTAVHSDDVDWCTNDHTDYSRHMDVTSGLEFPR